MAKTSDGPDSMALVPWEGCNKPIPQFLTLLPWAQTSDDAVSDIVQRILNAETVDEVLKRQTVSEFEDLFGKVITIHGFKLMASTIETGVGAYAVIDYSDDGETARQITTTSALGVMAALARVHQLGGFPFRCAVLEIDTGKNGRNNPVYLAEAKYAEPF